MSATARSENGVPRVALIAGVSGIVGLNIARRLVTRISSGEQWKIYGLSRRKTDFLPNDVEHIVCDLLKPEECEKALSQCRDTTHLFYATWQNHVKEELNCSVNGSMMKNLFSADLPNLVHCALVTGTKHYAGPFDKFQTEPRIITPFKETIPRQNVINFYYTLEDILFENAACKGFSWSVARPNTIIGFAPGNGMNLGTSVTVYASICKHMNIPFTFPGSPEKYRNLFDAADARLLADHIIWESTTPVAKNNAFNVVNGDCYRWKDMWKTIADYFGIPVGEYSGKICMVDFAKEYAKTWDEMVVQYGLKPYALENITSFWMVDLSMGRTLDGVTDMTKSREMGFLQYQSTEKSYLELFDELKRGKYIP